MLKNSSCDDSVVYDTLPDTILRENPHIPMVQLITGTSPKIDSCAGIIRKLADQTYSRVRESDRRWIDREDIIQDNLVCALEAEGSHRQKKGQKYSTHLYNRIKWNSGHLLISLSRQMRRASSLMELDAPTPEGETGFTLPDKRAEADLVTTAAADDRVTAFKRLVVAVQSSATLKGEQFRAIQHLVRVVLFRRVGPEFAELGQEIQETLINAAKKSGIGFADIQGCGDDEGSRKKLLQWAATAVIMEPGAENKLRCLECVKCEGQFTLTDVRGGRYFLEPGMCRSCYAEMQRNSAVCFGKVQTKTQTGYQSKDPACRLHCPDRAVCREIVKGRLVMATDKTATKKVKVDGKLAKGLDALDNKLDSKKAAAAAKPAKAVAKETEPAEPKPPKEFGGSWPWRLGSAMRYMFMSVFLAEGGLSAKKFEALFQEPDKKAGVKAGPLFGSGQHDYMLRKLRSGSAGKAVKTHTWKFTEDGGKYQIYDVKSLVKAKAETSAAPVAKKSEAVKSAKKDKKATKKK